MAMEDRSPTASADAGLPLQPAVTMPSVATSGAGLSRTSTDGLQVLGWDDLPQLHGAQVAAAEADLRGLGGRVHRVAGLPVRLMASVPRVDVAAPGLGAPLRDDGIQGGVWWLAQWGGQLLVFHLNRGLASALAHQVGLVLDDLSDEALDLLGHWRGQSVLPEALQWLQATVDPTRVRGWLAADGVEGGAAYWPVRHWTAVHAATGEPCGFEACVHAAPGLALSSLYELFETWVIERSPPPLGHLPWALPLVAARWQVEAQVMDDLVVGDVLLLEA